MSNICGWTSAELNDLCTIKIGGTPSRGNPSYWDIEKETKNLWVSIKDLNKRILEDTAEYITDLGIKKSNVKKIEKDQILLSFKLTIGKVAYAGVPLYTNEAIAGLDSNVINKSFLFYGLQYWNLLQDVDQAIKGATLNKEKLKKIKFEYPESDAEQSKIAEVLETIDCSIELTEALIAKQERIKTGLMQDLLTKGIDEKGNIRSEENHQFKNSPLGRLPEEWVVKSIATISNRVTDGDHHTPKRSVEGYFLLSARNINDGYIDLSDVDFVPETEYMRMIRRCNPEAGDILVSCSGTIGRVCEVPCWIKCVLVRSAALIKFNRELINSRFAEWIMRSSIVQRQIFAAQRQAAQPNLFQSEIENLIVTVPCYNEQTKIASILDSLQLKININLLELNKLQSIKTALMQDLLTGKKRVTTLLSEAEVNS